MAYLAQAYPELPSWFPALKTIIFKSFQHPWLSRIPGLVLYTFCTCTERSGTKLVVDGFAVDKQGKDFYYQTR
ncbi:hypothetical protein OUZ56_031670 [Daphnia magna]|uniref:Uncharacterized protein n=1 Tax=Daphnia magna TaxID=35525 RepID=A0ABQ9ZV06_9CRUS|nr:hypothetical protein OUZ56_031670 [Daphnia magna]